jgi:hypothetical protein
MTQVKWGAMLNVVAGALLMAAPFVLGYSTLNDMATYEAIVVGLLIGSVALWSATSTAAPDYLDYILAILGAWSSAAPFVFGYAATVSTARNTDIVMGIAVALIALVTHFNVSPANRPKVTA